MADDLMRSRCGRAVVLVALAATATWSCSGDDLADAATSSSGEESQFDEHARSQCPDTISARRLSGGRLVAAYDSPVRDVESALIPGDTEAALPAGEVGTVVCWYEDTTLTPPLGRGDPSVTDAVAVYINGQRVSATTVDGPPKRP